MKRGVVILAMLAVLAYFGTMPATAQDIELDFRTVTLIPCDSDAEDAEALSGVILDLHLIPPPAQTDKWYEQLQAFVANHTSFSWAQVGTDLKEVFDPRSGGAGLSLNATAREAKIRGGAIWKTDADAWYWWVSLDI